MDYYIDHVQERVVLGKPKAEKDLGVIVDNSGKIKKISSSCRSK